MTSIGECAFYECTGLKSVTIPSSVTSIGGSAFNGCELRTIIAKQTDPKEYQSAFSAATYTHAQLYVPAGTFWDYVYHSNWGEFIYIKESVEDESYLSSKAAYMLADEIGTNYVVFDSEKGEITTVPYSYGLDEEDINTCWTLCDVTGGKALRNMGAGVYATVSSTGQVGISTSPVALDITVGDEGLTINGIRKMLVVNTAVEPTAIATTTIVQDDDDTPIFDLQGRKLDHAPSKGMYIQNGKKVVVK